MLTADQNFRLLQEIEESRTFLLMAYQQNPKLLANAEARIQLLVGQSTPPVAENHQSSVISPQSSEHPQGVRRWVPRCYGDNSTSSLLDSGLPTFSAATFSQRGISLVELIMFIVIVSVALAGILAVMNKVTGHSSDTLVRKQALAIAESLLEEVELMPFTFCDPDDPNASTAADTLACTTPVGGEVLGTEGTETRYSNTTPFDNVSDYDGCGINTAANPGCDAAGNSGIRDITNTPIGSLSSYNASVTVIEAGIPAAGGAIPASEALRITVTVNGPNNETIVLDGYRTRYSPRSVP